MKDIEMYHLPSGKCPFEDWILKQSKDSKGRIFSYIDRVISGGSRRNIKSIGGGVFEIKIDYGPGFRVYFGEKENVIILLLIGGTKASQNSDITKAKKYWRNSNV